MDIYELIKKLIGPIDPIGETNEDNRRFKNLKEMAGLITELISDIEYVARTNITRQEFSMHRAGKYACKTLKNLEFDL